jgi:cytochrome c peroxidase
VQPRVPCPESCSRSPISAALQITGQCADIGKLKGPVLREIAPRPPYLHNGSATLLDVVNFYDKGFSISVTDQEESDLVAFLNDL